MDRRSFLKRGAATGAAAFIGSSLLGKEVFSNPSAIAPDIAVATGTDYFENTRKVVDSLGGMRKFVPKRSRVGLLINSAFETRGAYVNPDISLSVLKMCFEAKAKEVILLQKVYDEYWTRSAHLEALKGLFDNVTQVESNEFPAEYNDTDWKVIPKIEGSVSLREVEVIKALEEVDVLINIFIAKHHAGGIYTGAMKNSMGFCTRKSNVFFHLGSDERNNPDFLAQCIADINLLRQPDLIIGDATEFLLTNGPSGPGDTRKMDIVYAGTNLVGMDVLGVTYNYTFPEDVPTLAKAESVGLGSAKLEDYNVVEVG